MSTKKSKKEPEIKTILSKKQKMLNMVEEEIKIAEKLGESLEIGRSFDFADFGRDQYNLTGILGIDLNICGYKIGTVNVIYGDSQAGKTTFLTGVIEGQQDHNPEMVVVYFDTEQTIDQNFLDRFPFLNQENIFFFRMTRIETILEKIKELLEEEMVDLIIIDSIEGASTKNSEEKKLDENQMTMKKASILSIALPQIQKLLKKKKATLIIVQQLRTIVKQFITYEGRTGGKSLQFVPSTVLKISNVKSENEKNEEGRDIVRVTKLKNEKSKVSKPYAETFSFINTDITKQTAILKRRECLEYALEYGIIKSSKAWYYLDKINKETGEIEELKFNGKAKVAVAFSDDIDLYTETKLKVYAYGLPTEILIVKFDQILTMLESENKKIKKMKITTLKNSKREELIKENDYIPYVFNRNLVTPLNLLKEVFPEIEEDNENENYESGNEKYNKAKFNLLTFEEKKKKIEENEKIMEGKKKKKILEGLDD